MDNIKTLSFGSGTMEPTIAEEKCLTIRRYRPEAHSFTKGEVIMGIFEDGLNILLSITENTVTKAFANITDEEAQGSGYNNTEEAFEGLKGFYEGLKKSDIAAIIYYEVLKVKGIPVISFPETKAD